MDRVHPRPEDDINQVITVKRVKLDSPFNFSTSTSSLFKSLSTSIGKLPSTELQVGITQYLNKNLAPFHAIIKHRFTDFLVFELTPDGNVLHLNNINNPATTAAATAATTTITTTTDTATPIKDLWNHSSSALISPLLQSPLQLSSFETFVKAGPPTSLEKGGKFKDNHLFQFTTLPIDSKEDRGNFHKVLREAFEGNLVSETRFVAKVQPLEKEKEGVQVEAGTTTTTTTAATPPVQDQVLVISWKSPSHSKKNNNDRNNRPPRVPPPSSSSKPFIHLTLQKQNRESQDALSTLARLLRLQPKDIGSAGTKDKRGITVQRVSIRRGNKSLEDVWRACSGGNGGGRGGRGRGRGRGGFGNATGERGLKIGDLSYEDKGIELGGLEGNRFVITLRDVQSPSPSTIPHSLSLLSKNGFINYYGMQRFGTAPVPTHCVGLALLQSDWKLATGLILCKREGEGEDIAAARQAWENGDVEKAARDCPRRCVAEKAVLEHFARTGKTTDHLSALSRIPKNLRMMYVHAYQSYVFNRATSERIKRFGSHSPIVGDLILTSSEGLDEIVEEDEVEVLVDQIDVEQDDVGESLDPNLDDDDEVVGAANTTAPTTTYPASKIAPVRALTQADIDSGNFELDQVVLPLPGFAVVYPEGEMGQVYESIMSEDGVKKEDMFRSQKEYSLGGAYRHIIHVPKSLTSKLLLYTSPTQDLAQSDEDRLLHRSLPPLTPFENLKEVPEGQNLALQVEFNLGKGTFATMALREVLRSWTAAGFQKTLTAGMEERYNAGLKLDGLGETIKDTATSTVAVEVAMKGEEEK